MAVIYHLVTIVAFTEILKHRVAVDPINKAAPVFAKEGVDLVMDANDPAKIFPAGEHAAMEDIDNKRTLLLEKEVDKYKRKLKVSKMMAKSDDDFNDVKDVSAEVMACPIERTAEHVIHLLVFPRATIEEAAAAKAYEEKALKDVAAKLKKINNWLLIRRL